MQAKWIDLGDPDARLKLGQIQGGLYLFITGLPNSTVRWTRAVRELGFSPGQNNKYLVRRIAEGESPRASTYRSIFPGARITMMERDEFFLDFARGRKERKNSEEDRQAEVDLTHYVRLGRNANGDEVLVGSLGRVIRDINDRVVQESSNLLRPHLFLRANNDEELRLCADGFVRSMDKGEVQYREDVDRFFQAVHGEAAASDLVKHSALRSQIEAAMLRQVVRAHDTAQDAYGDATRLYDFLPPYVGAERGAGVLPLPLAVIAQRLLGDMDGKSVAIPNAFDGSTYAFLPETAKISAYRGTRDLSAIALEKSNVTWSDGFDQTHDSGAHALFFNADPDLDANGERTDYRDAARSMRALAPGGRAVLAMAGDDEQYPGVVGAASEAFLRALAEKYVIEDVFEVAPALTRRAGTGQPMRIISLQNLRPTGEELAFAGEGFPRRVAVMHGWNEIKERVDEALARAQVREVASDEIDLQRMEMEGSIQRPYLPFSKIGEARTMLPANLQGPMHAALSDVESRYGAVDAFVSSELGFQEHTLAERLSPEQVDGIALSISRIRMGRANILGDETGIGKGRTLGALAVWANKQGKNVVFVTDRANLFSDFYGGDLGDLNERGRFRPLILNSGEVIVDKNSPLDPPPVLVEASKADDIRRIVDENLSLESVGCNIVFATYSQINGEDSPKAAWLKNQLADALLIVDEAHIAAGADSNVSAQVASMTRLAWAVQYSTATWAKSSRNMHIYARAFPESINVGTLESTMARGGEAFAEVFSSMLARDGALTRREHDLSRLETVVEIDDINRDFNITVSDAVAGVMNGIAVISGDIDRAMLRINSQTVADLKEARDVRARAVKVSLFASSFGGGSVLYQVNRRMLAALNARHVARIAIKSIEDGLRPIIVFDDTGEALTNRLIDETSQVLPDGTVLRPDELRPPTIKDMMRGVVARLSRVRVTEKTAAALIAEREERAARERGRAGQNQHEDDAESADDGDEVLALAETAQTVAPVEGTAADQDEADMETAIAAARAQAPGRGRAAADAMPKFLDIDELPSLSPEEKAVYAKGMEELHRMIERLPDVHLNAPDVVHDILRKEGITTGEISGRKYMLVADGENGMSRIVQRSKKKAAVTASVRAFQNGAIDAMLLNRSGATGIGLHAQPRFADPRKRNMIWLQPPENPTDVTQLAGRGNRYDQLSAPRMTFAATGLYGELRQIMMNNKKQVMMACNVRSSRDASLKFDSVPDLLNEIGREVTRQVYLDNPGYAQRMGVSAEQLESPSSDPVRWLNKVTMLVHSDQEKIYQEIYAAFDEALLRHDLAGTNPLRAKEMDVGAEVCDRELFQGVETEGIGSAFDGPVYSQTIRWKERMTPMSWSAALEKVKASREALVRSGRAIAVGVGREGLPVIEYTTLKDNTIKQIDALARIALASDSKYDSLAQALLFAPPMHPVRRAHARMAWITDNLDRIAPGFTISIADSSDLVLQTQAVIVAVEPPGVGKEYQLGRWKVHTLTPGDNAPVAHTLASILASSKASDDLRVAQTVLGRDLFDDEASGRMAGALARRFNMAPTGDRHRAATVLTGNMYLASEWASASKAGHGVIFTDDRKVRHRAVILDRGITPQDLAHMPLRLWSREMIREFIDTCTSEENAGAFIDGVAVDHSFASAWANAQGNPQGRSASLLFRPGVGVVFGTTKEMMRRTAGQMRQVQKKISAALAAQHPEEGWRDERECTIKSSARKGVPSVHIQADTPEKYSRAVDVLLDLSGMEIYVQPHSAAGAVARQILDGYFIRKRDQAAQLLASQVADGGAPQELRQGQDEPVQRPRMAA